ncbi:hypothetical protein EW146_g9580 [Bondarzewia mesenterica]|uniref:Uncharacterized protein n=1 Tax=Bondarzewia mesenterica TaxID=1095465 RepID=A0A4S4L5A1_9AGAM|nr:hypothetical protein EW146_g9580 [Bondarzewia mesenterica]
MRHSKANSNEKASDNTLEAPHLIALKALHLIPYIQVPPCAKPAAVEPTHHVDPPIHPYAAAYNATYVSSVDKVTNEVSQPPAMKKLKLAYCTIALIYNEAITKDVYDWAMSSPIMHDGSQAKVLMQDDVLPFALDDLDPPCDIKNTSPNITVASFVQILHQPLVPSEGSLIIPDSYKAYFNLLAPDEELEPLIVTKESSALCSILPLIDHQQ